VLSYTRRHDDSITSTVTSRLNTRMYFREYSLFHYKALDPSFEQEYKRVRARYAYFLLKCRILSRKDSLNWHLKRLERPIKFNEYLRAIARRF
jgi:hypothetical protein